MKNIVYFLIKVRTSDIVLWFHFFQSLKQIICLMLTLVKSIYISFLGENKYWVRCLYYKFLVPRVRHFVFFHIIVS